MKVICRYEPLGKIWFCGAGGGILLSTIFLHMLPAVRSSIKMAVKKGVLSEETVEKYHMGELLICTG